MRKINEDKLVFFILSLLTLFLAFPTMLEVFSIPVTKFFYGFIICLCLTALFIKEYLIKVPIYFFIIIANLYVVGKDTLNQLLANRLRGVSGIPMENFEDISMLISFGLLFVFLTIMIEYQFVGKMVIFVTTICVSYLLLLNIFNDISVSYHVLGIFCFTLLNHLILVYGTRQPKVVILGVISLVLVSFSTLLILETNASSYLLKVTAPYRQELDKKGLYDYIASRKYKTIGKTGFDEDDSQLGGAILDDDTMQFRVSQKNPHYFRIDSKDIYTGKGWESSEKSQSMSSTYTDKIESHSSLSVKEEKETLAFVLFYKADYMPTTYGNFSLRGIGDESVFTQNPVTSRVNLERKEEINQVEMTLQELAFSDEELKKVELALPKEKIDYLQLPKNYSSKVKELAVTLTKDKKTTLDKVRGIESYLKNSSDFKYTKKEVDYPKDNEDYVAHFLFESKKGYCDNFSTSMVVMLRSLGIPSRWVKGFNTGEVVEKDGDKDAYLIRNRNAHSWVEVYFDQYGWLPFEPTPTFATPSVSEKKVLKKKETKSSSNEDPPQKKTNNSTDKETQPNQTKKTPKESKDNTKWQPTLKWVLWLFLIGILLIIFYFRLLVIGWLLIKRKNFSFITFYPLILRKFERKVSRKKEVPLLDYATKIEKRYPTLKGDFYHLTAVFEENLYGNTVIFSESDKDMLLRLLKKLHKK